MLLVILLVAAYFRSLSLPDWDADTGQNPDERFFTNVASTVRLPSSLSEVYDSARSPLNPRNYEQFSFYVYGPFPIYVTRLAAVALTPNDGPSGPILPLQVPAMNGPPRVLDEVAYSSQIQTDFGPLVDNPERAIPKLTPLIALFNPDGVNLTSYGQINKVGRGVALLFDLGTILLVFLIGRRLYDARLGLLAAACLAMAVMPIQQTHFFVDPIFSTFFATLALYWAVRIAQGGGLGFYLVLGLTIGVAMANRITLASLGLTAMIAALVALRTRQPRAGWADWGWFFFTQKMPLLILAGLVTLLSFRTFAPDAFSGSLPSSPEMVGNRIVELDLLRGMGFFDIRLDPRFVKNIQEVQGLMTGEIDFPPGQQWVGRPAYFFAWSNMVLWGMGPTLGLVAWLGWVGFGLRGASRCAPTLPVRSGGASRCAPTLHPAAWVLFVWIGFYLAWQGGQYASTMRYFLPLYGSLMIFAAGLMLWLWDAVGLKRAWPRLLVITVLLATLGWAYAFSRIYTQPHSRVIAARWLADHAAPGSQVMAEIWDDPLPLQTTNTGWGISLFGIESAPYSEDEPQKYTGFYNQEGIFQDGLLDQLDQADYITLTSNRVYASTARLRMRYPALMNYYHSLFTGDLGFELVADITSYPTILGLKIPDQIAEEAFSVYDHPRVLIFKKTYAYSRERAERLITESVLWSEVYKTPTQIADRNQTALRLTTSQWERYSAAGTWSQLFAQGWLANLAPLTWFVVLELLGLATFALLFHLFPRLPDRGFSLAKIVGLLLVAYLAWLLGRLDNGTGLPGMAGRAATDRLPLLPLAFTPATLWLCAAPLLVAGAYVAWRSRAALCDFARSNRAMLFSAEGIFVAFVLLGLVLRWFNPDLGHPARGGEKPMDLAYLTAVLKSAAFPPYDPWHAGGYINYYYFGFVLVGALVHLSGVLPSVGFNLAIATLFGLTALGAWGVVYNLVASRTPLNRRGYRGTQRNGFRATWGSSSAFLSVLCGQKPGHKRMCNGMPMLRHTPHYLALISALLAPPLLLILGNLAQALWYLNGYAAEQVAKGRPEWAFWDATRIVDGTVNEFPFFTFLFADLHPHLMVMPLSLALLGLGVVWIGAQGRSRVAVVVLAALLAGAIRATNTWDYPTFVGLTALTIGWVTWRNGRAAGHSRFAASLRGLGVAVTFPLLGNLLFLPFTSNFVTESSGLQPLMDEGAPSLLLALTKVVRTPLWELLQLYGLWLVVIALTGLLLLRRLMGSGFALGFGVALGGIAVAGSLFHWPALALTLPMLSVGVVLLWYLLRLPVLSQIPILWATAALGLLVLVDLVVIKGDVGRMNTVFKFGLHTWTLFALSASMALPHLWRWPAPTWARWVLRGSIGLLVAAALVYPLTATPARLADRWNGDAPHGLDGSAFLASVNAAAAGPTYSLDEDAAAIRWLQESVLGTPVLLEAHLPSYQWAGRIASFTGLPTLLGWEWHQIQQRTGVQANPVIANRQTIIAEIYNSPDPARALDWLQRYGVTYIYVGGVERSTYSAEGLAKFETMVAQGDLALAFRAGQTRIYQVVRPGQPQMLTSDVPLAIPTVRTAPPLMLQTPVNEQPEVNEYAWNQWVAGNSWLATLLWLGLWYALALLGLPVAQIIFAGSRDAGWGWSRLIGWLLLGWAIWLPTSLGLWRYNVWGVSGGLLLVVALNTWLIVRQGGVIPIYGNLRTHWAGVWRSELLFLAGFGAFVWIRASNPDLWHPIWGGEKPMEFGFLNAILRSPTMPPYDPFFSDGYINYYYYGLYLVSLPIKISGIAPAIGFNLAIATLFGLTLSAAASIVTRMSGKMRYGLIAAGLVAVAGNLSAIFESGWSAGWGAVGRALAAGGLAGVGERLGDWYIGPSRVIPFTINEFPFFAFLFADLHAHLIALPITLLVIALGYELLFGADAALAQHQHQKMILLSLALGALAVTNSWDFPTYALLTGLVLVGGAWRRKAGWRGILVAGGMAIMIAVGGMLLYAPFFDRYFAFVRGIGWVGWNAGTSITDYLIVFGIPMAILLPALLVATWRSLAFAPPPVLVRGILIALGLLMLVIAILRFDLALRLALLMLLICSSAVLLRRPIRSGIWYALLLAWLGWAVSLGVELIYIRDHLDGGDWQRMNTVFKFGMQTWVLLALAAAASLPNAMRAMRRWGGIYAESAALIGLAGLGLLALAYPVAAIPSRVANRFPVQSGPTLDGLAFLGESSFTYDCRAYGGCEIGVDQITVDLRGDAAAIAWLNREIRGTPIVVQSNLWFYRAYGIRIAANTGLPTVISALHANEQRDPSITGQRDAALAEFYTTTDVDTTLRFLATYRVNYIYIGGVERAFYPPEGLAKFAQLEGTYLSRIYDAEGVIIYRVTGIPQSYAYPAPVSRPVVPAPPDTGSPDLAGLERALADNPTDGPTAFGLAEQYRNRGRLDDAVRILAPAAHANPDDTGLQHLYGDILSDLGRYSEAEAVYTAAAQANPTAENWNKLGTALLGWGEADKAEMAFLQAISINPDLADPHYFLGLVFVQRQERDLALSELLVYLELAPDGQWVNQAVQIITDLQYEVEE
ncbi:Tetratricopeptide TPR_2 repeat protein [Oscillochloris trichoides DG-6]|uniref:Tetratricopeptide TPR_2 repeat protein n=1 Tax=Oscillochloris trichoides DG-6 TaxID=765420 RepID=E1IBT2_9CHLR|nr:Tetratricopeptide TPR_2 repeat protein [Oscillochloris trichoides DG-6]